MALRNNTLKYGSIAKAFHWLLAVLISGQLTVGLIMYWMSPSPTKLTLFGWHKSVGMTILLLAGLRLSWKLMNASPLLPYSMKPWERLAARAAHGLLYFFMLAMPLSGWAMSSAAGYAVSVYGWFTLPALMAPSPALKDFFVQAHWWMAWGLIGVIALHVMAALLHHFYYKDNVLLRMLPYGKLRKEGYSRSDTMAGC